jgi:hypothetical protein
VDVFEHDFAKDGLAPQRFGVVYGSLDHFNARPDGLHVTRPGGEGYNNSHIAPHLSVHGDFDIIASFEQFDPHPSAGSSSGVFLQALLDNAKSNECLVYRRHLRHRAVSQPIVQASYVTREPGGARRARFQYEIVEAASGRLRLARRGDTVYYLFAENDSPVFRLFGKETGAEDDLVIGGLRLVTQTEGEGLTKVVWKSLTIRAHRLSGLALLDEREALAELDGQRDALPDRFEHDFAEDVLTADRFHRWGAAAPQQPDENGLRVVAPGTDNWTSAGIAPQLGLTGDFDVAVTFDVREFGKPKKKLNSALYFQVEFPDEAKTQASVILIEYSEGVRQAYAQVAVVDAEGNRQYRRLRLEPVEDMEEMRIARRGKRVSFIYRKRGSDRERVFAQTDLLDTPIPQTNVRLMLHTGGAGTQSEILLKKFRVRAKKIDPAPPDAAAIPKH